MASVTLSPVGFIPAVDGVIPNIDTAATRLTPPMTRSSSSQTRAVGGEAQPPKWNLEDSQSVYDSASTVIITKHSIVRPITTGSKLTEED